MLNTPEIKNIYKEIQKKIFYMIPEKWESMYLYASIVEKAYQMPIGEMYFYYFPKSIIKKNPVNVYEIPSKFNIDENQYVDLVKNLYGSIQNLREEFIKNGHKLWTNITISIENFKFKIEYNYDELDEQDYSNYDRHIIWRYKYLGTELKTLKRKDRAIIERYLANKNIELEDKELYEEAVYTKPVHNSFDYNKQKNETPIELGIMKEFEQDRKDSNNQILFGMKEKKGKG